MPLGLPGATTISSLLRANTRGVPVVKPSPFNLSMFVVSAEANTSADAPCSICVTRVGVPAKLNFTVTPELAPWNEVPRALKAAVSDAAAKTETVPLSGVAGEEVLPQAASATAAKIKTTRLRIDAL